MAQLVREIMIEATPETIWPFLTEPDSLVGWHGTVAEIDPRPGGIYRVLVAGQFQSAGEYVEVVPMEKVVFTFGWEEDGHPIPPGSTTIEITLHPEGDKTRVRLVHSGLPERFALVTGSPPPLAAMIRRATSFAGTRKAIVPRRGATSTMVNGPGQNRASSARAAGVTMALASRFAASDSRIGIRLSFGRSFAT